MILALVQLGAPSGDDFVEWINLAEHFPLSGSDLFSIALFLGLAAVLWLVASERFLASKADGAEPAASGGGAACPGGPSTPPRDAAPQAHLPGTHPPCHAPRPPRPLSRGRAEAPPPRPLTPRSSK